VFLLTLGFTAFAVWRLSRRKVDRIVESREDFLTYPQTSPEIYAWLPYHRDTTPATESPQVVADTPQLAADTPRVAADTPTIDSKPS
jgi:hypothetical protein